MATTEQSNPLVIAITTIETIQDFASEEDRQTVQLAVKRVAGAYKKDDPSFQHIRSIVAAIVRRSIDSRKCSPAVIADMRRLYNPLLTDEQYLMVVAQCESPSATEYLRQLQKGDAGLTPNVVLAALFASRDANLAALEGKGIEPICSEDTLLFQAYAEQAINIGRTASVQQAAEILAISIEEQA